MLWCLNVYEEKCYCVFQNATAQAALQAASAVMGGPTEDGQKRTTLRIIVEHLVYPVGIEVLYQVSDIEWYK